MKYNPTIITRPLSCSSSESHIIDLPVGDSYFISLKEWIPPTLPFKTANNTIPSQVRNSLYLEHEYEGICCISVEGGNLVFKIKSTENVLEDTSVDWNISNGGVIDNDSLRDKNCTHDKGFDYLNNVHYLSEFSDFINTSGTATIPKGSKEVVVSVGTIDHGIWTGGVNSYKVFTVTLSNITEPDILLVDGRDSSVGLIEDSSVTPTLQGDVNISVKMHDMTNVEPLIDPSTGLASGFSLGLDLEGNSNLRTTIIDSVPMVSLTLVPSGVGSASSDDLSNGTVFVQAIIQSGRRD